MRQLAGVLAWIGLGLGLASPAMAVSYDCVGVDEDGESEVTFKLTREEGSRTLLGEAPVVGKFFEGRYNVIGNIGNPYRKYEVLAWDATLRLIERDGEVSADFSIGGSFDVEAATCTRRVQASRTSDRR